MGLKEEVQSWEAEKGGDSAPGELPPKQGGLCPLHQAVPLGPDDPSGSQTQLGCGGSPSEGWDEAPGALQALRGAVAQVTGMWWCPGAPVPAQESHPGDSAPGLSRDRMGTIPPWGPPRDGGHTKPLALHLRHKMPQNTFAVRKELL